MFEYAFPWFASPFPSLFQLGVSSRSPSLAYSRPGLTQRTSHIDTDVLDTHCGLTCVFWMCLFDTCEFKFVSK